MQKEKLTKDEILDELDNLRHELDYYVLYEPKNEEAINDLENKIYSYQEMLDEIELNED